MFQLLIASLRNALIVQIQIALRSRARSTHCMHFVVVICGGHSGSRCNAMPFVLRSVFRGGGGTQLFSGRGVRPGFPKCGACELIFASEKGGL